MSRAAIETFPTAPVDDLIEVGGGAPPFVSAVIQSEVAVPNAATETARHWRAVRRELEHAGASAEVLDAVASSIDGAHDRGPALGVIADADGTVHVEDFEHPVASDGGWVGPLPRLGPLVEDRQSRQPYVLVLADRIGADIVSVAASGDARTRRSDHADHPLKKVRGGGWSHRRMQQRAENTWEHNASGVADEVTEVVRRSAPRTVFLAGDVRAVELLRGSLPGWVAELVDVVPGTRAEGGDPDGTSHEVERALATSVASDTAAMLHRFREELGQRDLAVEGPEATLAALRRGQVELLLVHDDPDDDRTAWFGTEPGAVGLRADEVDGDAAPTEARLVDAAIHGALGTGGRVRMVPRHGGPADAIGALLRWAD